MKQLFAVLAIVFVLQIFTLYEQWVEYRHIETLAQVEIYLIHAVNNR